MPETVVMKFGGTSVAELDDGARAAHRRRARAGKPGRRGPLGPREDHRRAGRHGVRDLGAPLRARDGHASSVGERISCALCAMAIHDMGHAAVSLTGSQAGIVTDSSHTKARILEVRADRIREALTEDRIVLVAGFQGVSGQSRDVTTLGRGARYDRRRTRGRTGRLGLRDLHRCRGSLHGRPANLPRRVQARCSRSTRCSRCPRREPACCSCAPSSTRATTACGFIAGVRSTTAPVRSSSPKIRRWNSRWSQP